MKQLTVVFPTFEENGTHFILLGKQTPGKRMPGVRNGFGGKCEEGETVEDCAVREVREEIGLDLKKEQLKYIGRIIQGEKDVYFYTVLLESKISVADNDEMVDCRWFDVENRGEYIHEMLPGDDALMIEVSRSLSTPAEFKEFKLDMSDNKELIEATKNVFGGLK